MIKNFDSLLSLMEAFREPQAAIDHFTAIRWQNGRFCPHCNHTKIYDCAKKNVYKCANAECQSRFSITVGTIFENTKLPLKIWFGAVWMITNHPKGIASTTLAKDLDISQKTAWFVLQRLRHAARMESLDTKLSGTVEIDDAYIGGKGFNKHGKKSGQGGGPKGKTTIVGAIERKGRLVARVVEGATKENIQGFIQNTISTDANLIADKHPAYVTLKGYPLLKTHYSTLRTKEINNNSIEGVWSLLKRQIVGVHHWVSPKHLDKYVGEMTWRFNRRDQSSFDRMNSMFGCVEGRLKYRTLIA